MTAGLGLATASVAIVGTRAPLLPLWMTAVAVVVVGLAILAGLVATVAAIIVFRAERTRRTGG